MSAPNDVDRALRNRVIAVPEARQLDVLANLLEKRGATVLRCPLVGIKDHPDQRGVRAWIERRIAARDDLVVFYTGEGVERLLDVAERASQAQPFIAALGRSPLLTRGPKPKRALRKLGLETKFEPEEPTTQGLVSAAASIDLPQRRVAVQLYSESQDQGLIEHFRGRGVEPDCVAPYVYASAADDEQVLALIERLREGGVDAIAFTSKSQVQRLVATARERGIEGALREALARTRVAAVGPIVAAELEAAGFSVAVTPAASYTMKPLVTSLSELLGAG
jgi:uroporphyrinogen-III synthase